MDKDSSSQEGGMSAAAELQGVDIAHLPAQEMVNGKGTEGNGLEVSEMPRERSDEVIGDEAEVLPIAGAEKLPQPSEAYYRVDYKAASLGLTSYQIASTNVVKNRANERKNLNVIMSAYDIDNLWDYLGSVKDEPLAEIVDQIPELRFENWKYYKPITDWRPAGRFATARRGGRGRSNFKWDWTYQETSKVWEPSHANFVPYSHILPLGTLNSRSRYLHPFSYEQRTGSETRLAGLYTLPYDNRLTLSFQAFELYSLYRFDYFNYKAEIETFLSGFHSSMKDLVGLGGSFEVRDYDNSEPKRTAAFKARTEEGVALYGHKSGIVRTTTSRDAEEYFLNIPPMPELVGETSPWRRLIIFRGLSRLPRGNGSFWLSNPPSEPNFEYRSVARAREAANLHVSCGRRSAPEMGLPEAGNLFHITWFVFEKADPNDLTRTNPGIYPTSESSWKHGIFYGSKVDELGVASMTVQAFTTIERKEREDPAQVERDAKYWTILIFAPIWYSNSHEKRERMVEIDKIEIGSYLVTMLSVIKSGFSRAVDCWIEIGDRLDELLGNEDLILNPTKHDKSCFYDGNDDDFSQAKKCFWIINSVTKFERSITNTLDQWKWFAGRHVLESQNYRPSNDPPALRRLHSENELLWGKLKYQRDRFLLIQKEARELRDGLFGASSLVNARDSVKEARNSAKLGKTVELLTLVTIFFLPLGYITTLWAILALPDLKTFAGVSVGTALATYLVVLVLIKSDFHWVPWPKSRQ